MARWKAVQKEFVIGIEGILKQPVGIRRIYAMQKISTDHIHRQGFGSRKPYKGTERGCGC